MDSEPLEQTLLLAAKTGRWDIVSQLARELEARRLARDEATIVQLEKERAKQR